MMATRARETRGRWAWRAMVWLLLSGAACSDNPQAADEPEELEPVGPPQITTVQLPAGETMAFVWIAQGRFIMGSPSDEEGRFSDEGPRRTVTLSHGFFMGQYEVSQGQWAAVTGEEPWKDQAYVVPDPARPAVYISWEDAQRFIEQLNALPEGHRFRLPTEAEWEYTCRAGTRTRWSFGEEDFKLADYGWYRSNTWNTGLQAAQQVGLLKPNRWGLYDMHGNVEEWVQDWHGSYASIPTVDPTGPEGGVARVVRGGAVDDLSRYTRSACRAGADPGARAYFVGLRLVMEE